MDAAGIEVTRVHYYERPSGEIGASGLPDPVNLLHRGIWYEKRKDPPPPRIFDHDGKLFWLMRIFRKVRCFLIHK
ncbi:MAG: hypothetical protein ABSD56_02155 [Bryobacteraceae bacterium]